jgi:hypothetical protein
MALKMDISKRKAAGEVPSLIGVSAAAEKTPLARTC